MFVKICCISSIDEAKMAINAGASSIGLVGPMPSGPGVIDDDLIARIASSVSGIETVLLTSETEVDAIVSHHSGVKTSAIQLVDSPPEGSHQILREKLPNTKLIQVVHVIDEQSVAYAVSVSGDVDFVLLDSGNPNLEVMELGGTGRVHNWDLSRSIVRKSLAPVILAGGLNPENVSEAIRRVNPFGVDLCSGIRTNGDLDQVLLKRFMSSVF